MAEGLTAALPGDAPAAPALAPTTAVLLPLPPGAAAPVTAAVEPVLARMMLLSAFNAKPSGSTPASHMPTGRLHSLPATHTSSRWGRGRGKRCQRRLHALQNQRKANYRGKRTLKLRSSKLKSIRPIWCQYNIAASLNSTFLPTLRLELSTIMFVQASRHAVQLWPLQESSPEA